MTENISTTEKKNILRFKKKIAILGQGGVGKTTLMYRYVNGEFYDSTKMTIACDFFLKKINASYNNYENYLTMEFWDFSGQDRFKFMIKDYILGTECVLFVFDLTKISTLEKLHGWIHVLKKANLWNTGIKYFLVGTKKDLMSEDSNKIPQEHIQDFLKEIKFEGYFETSSLNGSGIQNLFREVAMALVKKENDKYI